MVPLVVAPYGGRLPDGSTVQRTFAATRSGEHGAAELDPRVVLLLQECLRHAKVIGAWGAGVSALETDGIPDLPGVLTGTDASAVFAEVHTALGAHRVWERFDSVST